MMLEEVDEREQFVAGLLFFVVIAAVWAGVTVLTDEFFGLVVGSIAALAAVVLYVLYRVYPEREQRFKEWIEELRYQGGQAKAEAEAFGEESGIDDGVAWLDARLQALGGAVRRRLDRTAVGRLIDDHLAPGAPGGVESTGAHGPEPGEPDAEPPEGDVGGDAESTGAGATDDGTSSAEEDRPGAAGGGGRPADGPSDRSRDPGDPGRPTGADEASDAGGRGESSDARERRDGTR